MGIKTIRVVSSGRVIGEGVSQCVGNIAICCDFVIIYIEMINACSILVKTLKLAITLLSLLRQNGLYDVY